MVVMPDEIRPIAWIRTSPRYAVRIKIKFGPFDPDSAIADLGDSVAAPGVRFHQARR